MLCLCMPESASLFADLLRRRVGVNNDFGLRQTRADVLTRPPCTETNRERGREGERETSSTPGEHPLSTLTSITSGKLPGAVSS